MPAEPTTTLVHYKTRPGAKAPTIACGAAPLRISYYSEEVGKVTCFACRRTEVFKQDQLTEGVEPPTPIKLSGVMAGSEEMFDLAAKAAAASWLKAQRNERGMYVIEEVIHHGDYRSQRRVEVYAINVVTVDAIIQSSAYSYGSWLHPENPKHTEVRRAKLRGLVEDLKAGRVNRDIGWSTFRLIQN